MNSVDIENPASLASYLRARGIAHPVREHHVLAGGVSNKTVLLRLANGSQWVLKQALEKLRVKSDWFSSPQRIHREAAGMRALQSLAPPGAITSFVFEDHESHILAMEAVPSPHENLKSLLLSGQLNDDWMDQFAQLLGRIHRQSWLRRAELASEFADRSFFESLRLEPYYEHSSKQEPRSRAFYSSLIEVTRGVCDALVHGDYSPKNVLVHQGRVILLDHEVIHWGDPAFDAGFALTHLLSKANHLPSHRERFISAAIRFYQEYGSELGEVPWRNRLEARIVRHTLGCLLARVVGRSPLEYLTPPEQHRQREGAVELMRSPPGTVKELIEKFALHLQETG